MENSFYCGVVCSGLFRVLQICNRIVSKRITVMVLIISTKTSEAAASNCELLLESGKCIHYVAPAHANPCKEVRSESDDIIADNDIAKRKSSYGGTLWL